MPLILLLALLLSPLHVYAREYKGIAEKVSDGDTLTMRAGNNRRLTIRLADIDAPEKKQPYGDESRQTLIDLVQSQRITVHKVATDKYRRMVGTVYRFEDGMNVNQEMVRNGNAWAYRAYLLNPAMLVLEDAARASETGLWALPSHTQLPPWLWRKEVRQNGLK